MSEVYQAFRINQNRKLTTMDAELSTWQDMETVSRSVPAFTPAGEVWAGSCVPEKVRKPFLVPGIVF